jgi:hypothetical protein
MEAKEWMQSMAKAFGKYEYKVKYKAEAGTVELKSPGWREDPPNLKAYKAIDCILPELILEGLQTGCHSFEAFIYDESKNRGNPIKN